MSTSDMQGRGHSSETIAVYVEKALKAFGALSAVLKGLDRAFEDQIQLSEIGDEYGRFRIWSGNIGQYCPS